MKTYRICELDYLLSYIATTSSPSNDNDVPCFEIFWVSVEYGMQDEAVSASFPLLSSFDDRLVWVMVMSIRYDQMIKFLLSCGLIMQTILDQ